MGQLTEVANKAAQQVVAAKEVSKEQRKQLEQDLHNLQEYMNEKQTQAASRRQAVNDEKIAKASPTKRGEASATCDATTSNAADPPAPPSASSPDKREVVGVAAPITPSSQ